MSIRRKLNLIIMIISTVSLLLASLAFISSDRINTRQSVVNNLRTMAEIIAANSSAAILFGDQGAAQETLGFLEAQEHIEAAVIYSAVGDEFAIYKQPGFTEEIPNPGQQTDNVLFWRDYVELFTPIIHEGEFEGSVYLRSDLRVVQERMVWFLGVVAGVLAASMLVTLVLSHPMQRVITDPLLRLSAIARRITTEKNYSLRVAGECRDELGTLIIDFNAMLDEIQSRDDELEEHRTRLEERVAQRTRELEAANRELAASKEQAESVARRMEYHAHHDALTGLPNRVLLNDRITTGLAHAQRQQTLMALLFLDLDRFKIINDSLGHAVGDQFLKVIAHRIKNSIREEDTVARLGGDEFMVLLPHISNPSDAGRIARKITAALTEPVTCCGNELQITTSVGISIYPHNGTDLETLVRHADISMYRAKQLGRNKAIYFTEEMNAGSRRQLELETSLRKALDRGELQLFYQPKININTDAITGVEALLRWEHPTMGFISPRDFIPVAENCGLIEPIGEWVLRTAFLQLAEWRRAGHTELTMAVNVSSTQLAHTGLDAVVMKALASAGIDAGMVQLEITENMAMQDLDTSIPTLQKLRQMGVSIAMDDFGTGYSSLSYLRKLPVDTIKIDHSFVREIPDNDEDIVIAQAIIAMAQSMHLSLIVEGIENVRQLNFFRQHGCEIAQGFLFSKPVTAETIQKMLQDQIRFCATSLVRQ